MCEEPIWAKQNSIVFLCASKVSHFLVMYSFKSLTVRKTYACIFSDCILTENSQFILFVEIQLIERQKNLSISKWNWHISTFIAILKTVCINFLLLSNIFISKYIIQYTYPQHYQCPLLWKELCVITFSIPTLFDGNVFHRLVQLGNGPWLSLEIRRNVWFVYKIHNAPTVHLFWLQDIQ